MGLGEGVSTMDPPVNQRAKSRGMNGGSVHTATAMHACRGRVQKSYMGNIINQKYRNSREIWITKPDGMKLLIFNK